MIQPATIATRPADPTVFGLTPTQLHDRFWASRGVQVVRQGEASEIVSHAELYMLTDPRTLTLFKLRPLIDTLNWVQPDLLLIRLHDVNEHGYRERIVADDDDRFVRFQRIYNGGDSRLARVALTTDLDLARMWQSAEDSRTGWRKLRATVYRRRRLTQSVTGRVYDRQIDEERLDFVHELVCQWKRPDATIKRIHRGGDEAWIDSDASTQPQSRIIGPVWVGAGRRIDQSQPVIGPAALWDDPELRPQVEALHWLDIEKTPAFERRVHVRQRPRWERLSKRAFDIAFALAMLMLTLPVFPLVMLAIWLEDGGPFFFGHERETVGGRPFKCWKFRSMRKDAEAIKARLMTQNAADGPQFFMENDPRLTRIGRIIRKLNIDELPQFINVLSGDMAVVGPRPSPFKENQFCPAWREARLSVPPGITGLWQVRRSRLQGLDFQEWIRYDMEYVENGSWTMDLWIIGQTLRVIFSALF
ncbi:MAG: sugar transferase [Phycisphaeraceae bacterium]|nr:sugar transferase [Phycisphaeraceae bacterium]